MTRKPDPTQPLTDPDEAAIQRMIAEDPEDHEWTEADFAAGQSLEEALPGLAAAILRDHPELDQDLRVTP